MNEIGKNYPEIEYVKRNIQPDHVHLVLSFPPEYSIAKVFQIIKLNTGKTMWENFDFLRQRYYGRGESGQMDITYRQWAWMRS